MRRYIKILNRRSVAVILLLFTVVTGIAQEADDVPEDSIFAISSDSDNMLIENHAADSIFADSLQKQLSVMADANQPVKVKKDWGKWQPDPKRALWLALVFPGGGQIYNRKYWKLPIIYGGFMGCIYAMNWNNNMYKDYSQAYLDISDKDPGTASYNKYLHLGAKIDGNEERYKQIFKSRKDKYRRWRDLSFFVMVGVYALSVIDAYVDAELSEFDISKDLSLKVEPTIMNNSSSNNPFHTGALGLNCSLNF